MHESISLESTATKFARPKHLELIAGIIVLVLIIVIGVSSLKQMITNSQMATASNTLIGSLNLARSEAMARNKNISICPTDDGMTCGTHWENGWLIFIDDGTAGYVDDSDIILKVVNNIPPAITFSSSKNYIRFNAQGNYVQCMQCLDAPSASWLQKFVEIILPGKLAYADETTTPDQAVTAAPDSTAATLATELRLNKTIPEQSVDNATDNNIAMQNQSIMFSLCDSTRKNETGRLIEISEGGKISSSEMVCE